MPHLPHQLWEQLLPWFLRLCSGPSRRIISLGESSTNHSYIVAHRLSIGYVTRRLAKSETCCENRGPWLLSSPTPATNTLKFHAIQIGQHPPANKHPYSRPFTDNHQPFPAHKQLANSSQTGPTVGTFNANMRPTWLASSRSSR